MTRLYFIFSELLTDHFYDDVAEMKMLCYGKLDLKKSVIIQIFSSVTNAVFFEFL